MRWGLIAFVIFAAFFELFIFTGARFGRYMLPAALILIGIWLLLRRDRNARRDEMADEGFTTPPTGKPKRSLTSASDELRRRIDLALAEEEEPEEPEPPHE